MSKTIAVGVLSLLVSGAAYAAMAKADAPACHRAQREAGHGHESCCCCCPKEHHQPATGKQ